MKRALAFLLLATLCGCASHKAVVPSLEGKPRIQINKQSQEKPVLAAPVNAVQGE
ncbi:hypothetical protein [Pseudomonas sp. LB3P58]